MRRDSNDDLQKVSVEAARRSLLFLFRVCSDSDLIEVKRLGTVEARQELFM